MEESKNGLFMASFFSSFLNSKTKLFHLGKIAGQIKFQVYRPVYKDFWRSEIEEHSFVLVGENIVFADGSGLQTFPIPDEQKIHVRKKDIVGWRVEGGPNDILGVIDYDIQKGRQKTYLTMTMKPPNIGDHITFPYLGDRVYSIACKYELQSEYFLEDSNIYLSSKK